MKYRIFEQTIFMAQVVVGVFILTMNALIYFYFLSDSFNMVNLFFKNFQEEFVHEEEKIKFLKIYFCFFSSGVYLKYSARI